MMRALLKITSKDIERGCATFEKKEGRDSMYRVASFLLQQPDCWGNVSRVADALAVLLLTWNAAFFRYSGGRLDQEGLERCLRKHWIIIERFHSRDIITFTSEDAPTVRMLFDDLLDALEIETSGTHDIRQSPVGVAKALHLLAPGFFPIWDHAIANAYHCGYGENPAEAYIRFCGMIREVAKGLGEVAPVSGKSMVKRIDEYNYARFSKGWLQGEEGAVVESSPSPVHRVRSDKPVLAVPDVRQALEQQLARAQSSGLRYVDIRAGDLHRDLGGRNRLPLVCHVMRKLMTDGDRILQQPPSGQGANVTIRFVLPRSAI